MTKNQKIKWLEEFSQRWDNITVSRTLSHQQAHQKRQVLEAELGEFCNKHDLPAMSADDLISYIKNPPIPLDKFLKNKKILTTQKAIANFFEKVLGHDYDTKHPYYRLHVYYKAYYIVEEENGNFYVEAENWYKEGTLEQMEQVLYDWAKDM